MAFIWRCFRHAWERKSRHVEAQARAPRSLRSRADALPMRAAATHGDNWALVHIPRRHQRRRWHCAPARRRGGRGRRSSRWCDAVPNAPAGGALPRAMDAAPSAAESGTAGCVPIGLPPPARARATATAALLALAAPAGAARPARGRRRGRGPRGTAAAGGLMCASPGPALCRLRAAGRRTLLPAGTRRAPHGRGASVRGGASAAGMAAARTAGGGPGRAGLAKLAQTPLLAISLTSARDATSAPSRALVRAPPGGTLSPPPPPEASPGGGAQPKRLRYVKRAGRAQAALPALPAPPRMTRRARGGTRGTGVTRAGRAPGRTHTRGGGTTASLSPPPLPRAGGYFWGHLPPADGGSGGVIN